MDSLVACQNYRLGSFSNNEIREGHTSCRCSVTMLMGLSNCAKDAIDKDGSPRSFDLNANIDAGLVLQLLSILMAFRRLCVGCPQKASALPNAFDVWPEDMGTGGAKRKSLPYETTRAISKSVYRKADAIIVTSPDFEKYLVVERESGVFPPQSNKRVKAFEPTQFPGDVQGVLVHLSCMLGAIILLPSAKRGVFGILFDNQHDNSSASKGAYGYGLASLGGLVERSFIKQSQAVHKSNRRRESQ